MLANVENGKIMGAADFVAGFVYGMTTDNNLSEIEACFTNSEQTAMLMYNEVESGIADIKHGGWDHDVQAAFEFGLVALQIPQLLHSCPGVSTDIAAIESWAAIFKDPSALVSTVTKHFLFHKKEITADLDALKADWANDLYWKSGVDLADTLTLAVGPIEAAYDTVAPVAQVVPDFTAGLILGFTGHDHKAELELCMSDLTPIAVDAHAALDDILHTHFIHALQDVGDIFWMLPDAVSGCKDLAALQADIDVMLTWAEQFKNPSQAVKIASKNWLFHGVEIKKDIADEKAAWASADYFSAGQDTAAGLIRLVPETASEEFLQ